MAKAVTRANMAPISSSLLERASVYMLDWLGCVYAGVNTAPGRKLIAWAEAQPAGPHAVPGLSHGLQSKDAVFYLGALGHIVEFDDLHRASVLHPAVVVFPACYILASERGSTGHELLSAALVGYEIAIRVGEAVGKHHYRSWHTTSTAGVFGAAAACAWLMDLDAVQVTYALGSAGSMSGGLWAFLAEGVDSKFLHTGHAASSGLLAAQLAANDFSGASEIFEHPTAGFFAATCGPDQDPDALIRSLDRWQDHPRMLETSIKPYPSCRHTHACIDAALEIRDAITTLDAISSLTISTYQAALDLCDRPLPTTPYEAKFSLQYTLAASLVWGRPVMGTFAPDHLTDPAILNIMSRVSVQQQTLAETLYPKQWTCQLEVGLNNGAGLTRYIEYPLGDPQRPLTIMDLQVKFQDLLANSNCEADRQHLMQAIISLPERPQLPNLFG